MLRKKSPSSDGAISVLLRTLIGWISACAAQSSPAMFAVHWLCRDVPGNVGNGGIPPAAAAAFAGAAMFGGGKPREDPWTEPGPNQDVNDRYQDAFKDLKEHQESYHRDHPPARTPPAAQPTAFERAQDTAWEAFWTMGGKVPR